MVHQNQNKSARVHRVAPICYLGPSKHRQRPPGPPLSRSDNAKDMPRRLIALDARADFLDETPPFLLATRREVREDP